MNSFIHVLSNLMCFYKYMEIVYKKKYVLFLLYFKFLSANNKTFISEVLNFNFTDRSYIKVFCENLKYNISFYKKNKMADIQITGE